MLLIEADDNLRLDRAIAEARNDRLLNFRYRPSRRGNLTGVGYVDTALLVDGLCRQIDEIAGTRTGCLSRGEQAARRSFEDRYIKDVSDTDDLDRPRTLVWERALERDQVGLREQTDRVGAHIDQRIRQRGIGPYTGGRISNHGLAGRPGSRNYHASRQ